MSVETLLYIWTMGALTAALLVGVGHFPTETLKLKYFNLDCKTQGPIKMGEKYSSNLTFVD